ncbi:hypothetical protein C8R44DRAFT_742619 [Mycena epipterygia]|nr:hypothetical protein C8R44DRAFT_742619 [Mycena epipterygia]
MGDIPPSDKSIGQHEPVVAVVTSDPMSSPEVGPNPDVVRRFWKRISDVSARCYDTDNTRKGSNDIRQWNEHNRKSCAKCTSSRGRRICVVDEDHPSCKTCRSAKIGCDRKLLFLFDMTKAEYFPSFDQFIKVFHSKEHSRPRRNKRTENWIASETRPKQLRLGVEQPPLSGRITSMECRPVPRRDDRHYLESLLIQLGKQASELDQLCRKEADLTAANFHQTDKGSCQLITTSTQAHIHRINYFMGLVSAHVSNITRGSQILRQRMRHIYEADNSHRGPVERALEIAVSIEHEAGSISSLVVPFHIT